MDIIDDRQGGKITFSDVEIGEFFITPSKILHLKLSNNRERKYAEEDYMNAKESKYVENINAFDCLDHALVLINFDTVVTKVHVQLHILHNKWGG